jgi:DNA-binding response OmpR family regulator
MKQKQILIVEVKEGIQKLLKYNLTKEYYKLNLVDSGDAAFTLLIFSSSRFRSYFDYSYPL